MRGGGQFRTWLGRAQWVLIPLAVLGLAEVAIRLTVDRVPRWYAAAGRVAAIGPVSVLFIGSSRVQAAVVPEVFADTMAARGRPGMVVLNLGRGYSTDAEHFLGLRNLFAAHPANLRGVTVFAEGLGGFPFASRWSTTPWAAPEQPWMLADLLAPSDLPALLGSPGLRLEQRVSVATRVLGRRLSLYNRRERIRETWFEDVLPAVIAGRRPVTGARVALGDDLQGPGRATSIRSDPAVVALARELARKVTDDLAGLEDPVREWEQTIPEQLVRLVRERGGRVVFFDLPQSDAFLRIYRKPVRVEDAAAFARQARAWGTCVVRPAFRYSDEDLPDLWHLRAERAAEYTRALARDWAETCGAAP